MLLSFPEGADTVMPENVELKARIECPERIRQKVSELTAATSEKLLQEDIFYHAPRGRLKLRKQNDPGAQLIFYRRPDSAEPTPSTYHITPVSDPDTMHQLLEEALGVRGRVKKTRHLWWIGQTRVHLDSVQQLGEFIELEVVLREDQTQKEGAAIATNLMHSIGIDEKNLVDCAYIDLLADDNNSST